MRKRLTSVLAIIGLVLGGLVSTAGVVAAATDPGCTTLGGDDTTNPGVCQVSAPVTVTGTITVGEPLHLLAGGVINAPTAGVTLNVTVGDMTMDGGSSILAPGQPVTINVPNGNMLMKNGSLIRTTSTAGGGSAGDVTIHVGNFPNIPPMGVFTMETGSVIEANNANSGVGGDIEITAGHHSDIDGHILSQVGGQSGTGAVQGRDGGTIFVSTGCGITIGQTGILSSRGSDAGADLVHLESCDVVISGLVESTGAGHAIPNNPVNSCNSAFRPGKPANSTGCIEVWAENITITGTGEVNADINASGAGGAEGESWIDLFATSTISITGSAAGPFAVHADTASGTDLTPNTVTAKVVNGTFTATGNAISASSTGNGSFGGEVVIEASGVVNLNNGVVAAAGDNSGGGAGNPPPCDGGAGACGGGGTIAVRSFNANITWQNGVGNVNPDRQPSPNAGTISLTACTTVNTTGTNFDDAVPTVSQGILCGGSPLLPAGFQVVFRTAIWAACNAPPPTRLTLVKQVNNAGGGTALVTDWTLTATGPTTISGTSGSVAVTNALVTPGVYTLTEVGPANYSAGPWNCTAGTLVGNQLTLAAGQTATCTIINTFQPTRLTLVKQVNNAGGGTALVTDWTLTATGPTTISGTSGSVAVTNALVTPGVYTLTETGPANYSAGPWNCTAGTLVGNQLTLAAGQTATCTIINTFVPNPTRLTLVKQVNNAGGGTALVTDWTLTATGPTTISGTSGSVAVTNALVTPGVYTLTEVGPANYSAGPWNCTAGTLVGNQLTLAAGQTATCTIINTFQPTRLTLVKQIAGGGPAVLADFTLSGAGPTPISGISGTAAVTNVLVGPGAYTLSETLVANYSAGPWNCVGGTQVGNVVTLTAGQSATCTIVNTFVPQQQQTHLTLVKQIVGGGPATLASFTLSAAGPTPISGISGTAAVTNALVGPGTYTLSETTVPGYTASAWVCVGGTQVGNQITLTAGQSATCTITNTFVPQQAPQTQLTLVKQVVNTGGGTAAATAWTLTATGPTTISGATGSPAVTAVLVSPGVYTLTETGPSGYTASTWSCTGGTLVGNQLTLALGQNATCTIVNTFVPVVVEETCPPGTVPASITQTRVGVTQQIVCTAAPTPTGTVQAATSRPRITLPPTDTGLLPTSSNGDGGLGVILVLLAGIAAIVPILVRAGQKGARVAAQSEAPRRPTTWTPRSRPTDSTPRPKRDGR